MLQAKRGEDIASDPLRVAPLLAIRVLVPACCLTGTLLLLFCDVIAQLPSSQVVLPINIITALIGAPVVVALLLRQKNVNVY